MPVDCTPDGVSYLLIRRAETVDLAAFRSLVQLCRRRTVGLIRRMISRREDTEDVAQEVFLRTLTCSAHPGRPLATTMVRIAATGPAPVRAARLPARISASPDLIPSGWCWARWPRISTASCCGTTPGWSSATTMKLPSGSSLFSEQGGSQRFRRSRETLGKPPCRHSGGQPDGDRNEVEFGR
jgi:hypothetical protein